jgi:hypothetical protein
MKLIKCRGSILILISLALIFALGVMTSISQEKEIRDFLKSKVTTSGAQATAGTLNYKSFNHVTKHEVVPIADAVGHVIGVQVREGTAIFENGDLAWMKATLLIDVIKGSGTLESYTTYTFLDGSMVITHNKGAIQGTPQGVSSESKISGDVIHGTGRFQGIKGTVTTTTKMLPAEKGELAPKAVAENNTLIYTLPGK